VPRALTPPVANPTLKTTASQTIINPKLTVAGREIGYL